MTFKALSLAALSHPDAKYHSRRSPRIASAASWARENNHTFDRDMKLDLSGYSGDQGPEMAVIATLLQQLQNGTLPPGTVLILDDFGSLGEPRMRSALPRLMGLVNGGMGIVTLRDGKLWDAQSLNDIGGFLMSLTGLYSVSNESCPKPDDEGA